MNTVISFEVAKLLKEKEFDEVTDLIYMTNHTSEVLFENINGLKHLDGNNPFVSAPTIAEVVMWLYEKHGIWIDVVLSRNEKQFTFMIQSLSFDANKFLNEYFNSPTEAYEAAIEYTLNNLI